MSYFLCSAGLGAGPPALGTAGGGGGSSRPAPGRADGGEQSEEPEHPCPVSAGPRAVSGGGFGGAGVGSRPTAAEEMATGAAGPPPGWPNGLPRHSAQALPTLIAETLINLSIYVGVKSCDGEVPGHCPRRLIKEFKYSLLKEDTRQKGPQTQGDRRYATALGERLTAPPSSTHPHCRQGVPAGRLHRSCHSTTQHINCSRWQVDLIEDTYFVLAHNGFNLFQQLAL